MKILILLQGRLVNQYVVDKIKSTYDNYKDNCVISTWDTEPDELVNNLIDNDFKVIINKMPDETGINNFNLQITSTKICLKSYLDSDYTHVLKIRTDMVPNDIKKFIGILIKKSVEKLVFLCWFIYEINYLCDFFSFGPIKKSYKFWNIEKTNQDYFPERHLTWSYTNIENPTFDDIKHLYTFCINELRENDVKLIRTTENTDGLNLGIDQVTAFYYITKDFLKNY